MFRGSLSLLYVTRFMCLVSRLSLSLPHEHIVLLPLQRDFFPCIFICSSDSDSFLASSLSAIFLTPFHFHSLFRYSFVFLVRSCISSLLVSASLNVIRTLYFAVRLCVRLQPNAFFMYLLRFTIFAHNHGLCASVESLRQI